VVVGRLAYQVDISSKRDVAAIGTIRDDKVL
jgi:hypothetical protein